LPILAFSFAREGVSHVHPIPGRPLFAGCIFGSPHSQFFGSIRWVYRQSRLTGLLVLSQVFQHGKQGVTLAFMLSEDAFIPELATLLDQHVEVFADFPSTAVVLFGSGCL
jgi:hypothetical protein